MKSVMDSKRAIAHLESMATDCTGQAATAHVLGYQKEAGWMWERVEAIDFAIDAIKQCQSISSNDAMTRNHLIINPETDMANCPICGSEMGNYKSSECGYGVYCKGGCAYSVVGENCHEDARSIFNRIVGAIGDTNG